MKTICGGTKTIRKSVGIIPFAATIITTNILKLLQKHFFQPGNDYQKGITYIMLFFFVFPSNNK